MVNNMKKTLIISALTVMACQAFAQGKLTGFSVRPLGEGFEVQVKGEDLGEPKQIRVMGNKSLMLEFDASLSGKPETFRFNKHGLTFVQSTWYSANPATVRIHLRLNPKIDPVVTQNAAGWLISWTPNDTTKTSNTAKSDGSSAITLFGKNLAKKNALAFKLQPFPTSVPPITDLFAGRTLLKNKQKTVVVASKPTVFPTKVPAITDAVTKKSPSKTTDLNAIKSEPTVFPTKVPALTDAFTNVIAKDETTKDQTVLIFQPSAFAKAPKIGDLILDSSPTTNKSDGKTVVAPKPFVFPTKVPPIGNAVAKAMTANVNSFASAGQKLVTLDFTNTDIVQILKALALQAGVNIVTSPEVKGQLTVALDRVTMTEALDLVTTLAGVRYAKTGKTYIVTSSAKFAEVMRSMGPSVTEAFETRVVPIFSGEGNQIKAAVLHSAVIDTESGRIELLLPSDELKVQKTDSIGAAPGAGADAGKADPGTEPKTTIESTSGDRNSKDAYVVVVGPGSRLAEIERQIRLVDQQLCRAMGVNVPTSNMMVRKSYSPRGAKAMFLLQSVAGKNSDAPGHAKIGTVELFATPLTSNSDQVITLYGRESEVDQLLQNFASLDSFDDSAGGFFIYDVKYLDPRAVKQQLENEFPGLTVSLSLPSVATPGLFKEQSKSQSQGGNEQKSETKTEGTTATSIQPDDGNVKGISLPFTGMESTAQPMKVIIRGNKFLVEKALAYLQAVDVAVKQVALELRVMDLSKEDALKMGIDWSVFTGGSVKAIRMNQGTGANLGSGGTFGGGNGTGVQLKPNDVPAISIAAQLDQLGLNGHLIARPNIFAVDGRQSEIFVGEVIRYIESIQSTQQGITVTTKELPVGVRLAVLPRIGGDGDITMDLRPVVSSLTGFTPVPGGGNLPQTSLRIAQSTMVMRSGETIAIGGLIQDSDTFSEGGIPILKDLPILGKLFSRTTKNRRRSEVVMFLTAKIVDEKDRYGAADPRSHNNQIIKRPASELDGIIKNKAKGGGVTDVSK